MKSQKDEWKWQIEIPGYLFLVCLFLGIWINEYRWKLISTSLFFVLVSTINTIVTEHRNKQALK